eukprot:TRINITY_DN15875_c0_g1_i1.p1 TRINITY_DN15875_c0_g1~~TRINITY_DN15875_c0_g1_i1.p1  ORF type:complete len:983 (+),score=127.90 TRINITY_DN15875_c0_g1_i1:847-3795(+)
MASLIPIPSIIGVTCSQSPADSHLYNNLLPCCTNFEARSRNSFSLANSYISATHCCDPSGLVLRASLSVSAARARAGAGLARGARGWQDAPVGLRLQGVCKFVAPREGDRSTNGRATGGDALQVSSDSVHGAPRAGGVSNRVLKLDEIWTPLTVLASAVGTSADYNRLVVGSAREFWIIHVLLSGLVPTLVGWQLLQYSCGLLDGWLLPTRHRTKAVCGTNVAGEGISRQREDRRIERPGLSAVGKSTFSGKGADGYSQETTSRLSGELTLARLLQLLQKLRGEVTQLPARLTSRSLSLNSQRRRRSSTFPNGGAPFLRYSCDFRELMKDVLKGPERSSKSWDSGSGTRRLNSNVAICRLESWLSNIRRTTQTVGDDFRGRSIEKCTAYAPTNSMSQFLRKGTPPPAVARYSDPGVISSYFPDMGFLSWFSRMSRTYGTSFMGLIVVGYWIQGFRSFPWLAVSFLFKDGLQVDPATMQFIFSSASLPMVAKPIYGIMSDALYIRGCHRVPYLAVAAFLQALSWGFIVLNPGSTASLGVLTALLTMSNMGAAIAEVMNDALVAEAGKKDPNSTGELQSLAWIALATGGVLGSLSGGLALRRIDCHTMFSIFLLMVSAQLIVCLTVNERSFGLGSTRRDDGAWGVASRETEGVLSFLKVKAFGFLRNLQRKKTVTLVQIDSAQASTRLVEDGQANLYRESSDIRDAATRDVQAPNLEVVSFEMRSKVQGGDHMDGANVEGQFTVSKVTSVDRPSPVDMMRQQVSMLMELLRKPEISRPLLWFVASYAMIPALGSSLFFFQTQELHIDPAFLGLQKVVGQLGLMAGSVMFNRYLKQLPLRKVVACVQCLLCFCMLSDFLLVTRINMLLGIRDELFVLGVSAFVEAVAQFKVLPFMVLLAKLCPAGSEGSLLAFFMSAHCLANTISAYLGVALASYLQISSNSFTYLPLGIFLQAMAALVPVTLISLIPEDPRTPPRLLKVEKKIL